VTETWVEGNEFTFMNHFDNDGPRTTNNVEGWHSKLNKVCDHAHPNIFAMVTLLQSIQTTNETSWWNPTNKAKQMQDLGFPTATAKGQAQEWTNQFDPICGCCLTPGEFVKTGIGRRFRLATYSEQVGLMQHIHERCELIFITFDRIFLQCHRYCLK
jgi:hypothetical protein